MELLGKALSNYRLDRLLAEGSMGAVYQAYDLSMQRDVAIKVIHPQFAHQPGFREKFPREVSAAAQLNHPGLIKVLDFGQHKDQLYIVMEYLPGPNLRQLLDELIRQREWLSLNDAVRLVEQLCRTIEYVHQHDSLHWDINPANLMIKPEPAAGLPFRVVLIDLQLARLLEVLENDEDRPSAGTPAYMSPEQILGNAPDARSNIYSLGVLLYELVVGILPFPIKNVTEALLYYAQGDATPTPRSVRPDLPEGLEHVIMKALEKEPAERFGSAAEMGAALAAAMGDLTEIAEQEGAPDGNLFKKYQDSLAEPVSLEPASLLSEPEVGKTEMQSAYATERMDLPSVDQVGIQVQMEGRPPQTLTLDKDTVIIGRDRESDLILDDPRISRRHAQLTRDGSAYYVMDLNSANGTYLDNARIQAATPTIWRPQQELKIGGACLRLLVMGAIPTGTVLESYGAGSHTMLGAFDAEPIVITVTPQQLTVEAGDSVTATLSLLNQGFEPDYFSLSLSGIPNDWVSSLPSHVELMPGEQKVIAFTLDIPRSHQSRAGRHAITLRATSQRDPSQAADLTMALTITPFSEFRAELSPRLQAGQVGRITISNLGNIQELFTVRLADISGELVFEPAQAQIRIPEGQTGFVEFRAAESQLRLLGGQKTHTVSAVVSTPTAEPQALHGELLSPAFLPAWVLPTTLLLCLFTAGAAAMIFAILNRSATLTVVKNGEGKVTSSPVGIDCGSICEYNFDNNDTVTLSAEPTSTYTFGGWSGGGCSGAGPCTISMRSDQTVTAIFNPPGSKNLVVVTAGAGTGTVSSSPLGITNCAGTGTGTSTGTCIYAFPDNTTVTLSAVAGGTSTFGGWGGACSGTSLTCTVTMSDIQTVIANFNQPGKKTLTVSITGSGTVTSSPAGLNCTSTCTFDFTDNTPVTLSASPASNFTFGGWAGACSGTATCSITMSSAQSVSVTFNRSSQSLTTTTRLNPLPNNLTGGQTNIAFTGQVSASVPVPNGQTVQFHIRSGGCTGAVTTTVTATTTNGNGSFSSSFTAPTAGGTYGFQAAFPQTAITGGDTWQQSVSECQSINVISNINSTTSITSDNPDPSTVGQAVVVTYQVTANPPGSGTPTGNVTVSVTGSTTETCTGTVAQGQCTIIFTSAGDKSLTATYLGEGIFVRSQSTPITHQVKVGTTTSITSDNPDPSTVGQAVVVQYQVTANSPGLGNPTGNVTVSVTGSATDTCTGTVAQGQCTINFTGPGQKSLTATYVGEGNFTRSDSVAITHQVNQAGTTTSITSDNPDPSAVGQAVVVQYQVTSNPPGSGTPTGNVTVSVTGSSTETCTATVAQGQCTINFTNEGQRSLTATYLGDANFTGSQSGAVNHQVNRASTTTTITSVNPDPPTLGQGVMVQYRVSANSSGLGNPTGNVTVSVAGSSTETCTGTVAQGQCTINFASVGEKNLTATYAGDTNFTGSESTTVTRQVKVGTTINVLSHNPDPSTVGQAVVVQYQVTGNSPGLGTPTGNVTVSVTGNITEMCTGTVASGQCTINFANQGQKSLIVTYVGEGIFAGSSSSPITHQVNAAIN